MRRESKFGTRDAQYLAIIEAAGLRRKDCSVLAIVFCDPAAPGSFHYEAMRASWHDQVVIYDTIGMTVRLFFRKDQQTRDKIVELAKAVSQCSVYDE